MTKKNKKLVGIVALIAAAAFAVYEFFFKKKKTATVIVDGMVQTPTDSPDYGFETPIISGGIRPSVDSAVEDLTDPAAYTKPELGYESPPYIPGSTVAPDDVMTASLMDRLDAVSTKRFVAQDAEYLP